MRTTETILEYDKVLGMLAERAIGDLASEVCKTLTWSVDRYTIEKTTTETNHAVSVCLQKGTPPFSSLPDIKSTLSYAEKGGTLTPKQLLSVSFALGSANSVRTFLMSDISDDAGSVTRPAAALIPAPELRKHITNAIVSDSEIADGASTALRRIRRSIDQQNEKIKSSLAKYITGTAYDSVLMDKVITIRNGRFVVPVKQEQQYRFPGIVHDKSKGGATVFVEPQNVVEMNNKLRELELEEHAEIEIILSELTAEVAEAAEFIRENQDILIHLDFVFAKANLALDMKACPAMFSEDGEISIEKGRNPLIDSSVVVPIDICFGGNERLLIITGPNTGGKTVTLKTVGLFLLMAQSGLHVPAFRATLPIIPQVYVDIGDEQSIEQSLSTFSSHMKRIVGIVSSAGPSSLVLLDELGAGTDPTEGAALAIAILERLREKNVLVMATTHYTELKKYAIGTEGVSNASMEFDLNTLSPTFRLNMGNPGRSNAFEIALRLGLENTIVSRARDLLDTETIYFDDVMEQIELDRRAAAIHLEETEQVKAEALTFLAEAESRLKKVEQERNKILSNAADEAERIISETTDEADEVREELKTLIKDVRTRGVADGGASEEGPVNAGDALRIADEGKKKLKRVSSKRGSKADSSKRNDKRSALADKHEQEIALSIQDNHNLSPGDMVRLPDSNNTGEVLTAPDDKGRVFVRVGAVKLTLQADELEKLQNPAKNAGSQRHRYAKIVMAKMGQVKQSIDLHGKNLDEAEMLVEKYLDDAILARMHEIVINHGRGSGILRTGIRKMLRNNKHVAKFRNGDANEGGDGVTIVTLSDK